MQMSLFCVLTKMHQSQEALKETVKSVNPMDLDPFVSDPFKLARSEHVSTEVLLKIC